MNYVGRFAPSPTGPLHFGSLVAALASYLDARAHGGQWLIRIEDVDETRCHTAHTASILATLAHFGFEPDGAVIHQTQRKPRYEFALRQLSAAGQAYACTCSRREIADSALTGIDGPIYAGTCRHAGHAWAGNAIRVLTDNRPIAFHDRVQGVVEQRLESQIGDFIIRRRDSLFAYQLAVVVDDHDQGVTHVVRGADLIDSTPRQIHLQRLLGFATPDYLHIPVATNEAGQKLSKQTLAPDVSQADARALLIEALIFLGQDTAGLADSTTHRQMLEQAAGRWTISDIPVKRALVRSNPAFPRSVGPDSPQ